MIVATEWQPFCHNATIIVSMKKFNFWASALAAALCWLSLCMDWDLCMYITGIVALVIIGLHDLKVNFREVTEKFRRFSVKNSVTSAPSRKEVVKA